MKTGLTRQENTGGMLCLHRQHFARDLIAYGADIAHPNSGHPENMEMAGFPKLLRSDRDAKALSDAELLAFLTESLRPTLLRAINGMISKEVRALAVCLLQQEKLLTISSDSPHKEILMRNITGARVLCDKIQADLNM